MLRLTATVGRALLPPHFTDESTEAFCRPPTDRETHARPAFKGQPCLAWISQTSESPAHLPRTEADGKVGVGGPARQELGAAGRRKGTQPRGGKFLKHEGGTRCGERFSVGGQQLKHEWAPLPGPRRGWCSFLYLHVEAS